VRPGRSAWLAALLAAGALQAGAQAIGPETGRANRAGQLAQAMRYQPDGLAFVILNGSERFNRPLYGGNTAFRVDGGDRPEFVLYLPGRGGNLRLAVRRGGTMWWLSQAERIATRYLPGELAYEIRDPRLGAGVLRLRAVADYATEGLLLQAQGEGIAADTELLWAFGGVSGERGRRDGDIGTERVPISEWFQPKPAFADGNRVQLEAQGFTLTAPAATLKGVVSHGGVSGTASADDWDDVARLFTNTDSTRPLATGYLKLDGAPAFLSIQMLSQKPRGDLATYAAVAAGREAPPANRLLPAYAPTELAARFHAATAEAARRRTQVAVDTPDAYLNAAVAALNIGADATWDDSQQAVMHGAIAWRTKLLGWRGPYALDALGWHDRAVRNFRYWFGRQNTSPVPSALPGPDEDSNLSRAEAALHSNGDLSHSHYDMNSVFIDALFRHLAWTGDKALAREAWPVIQRHLAWQQRLFRRTFDASGLPLYESYAQIWASDDIHYGGGGTAYGSAYNVYANRQAARQAELLGEDAAPYRAEADAVQAGMQRYLWNPARGHFAEYKDVLGAQLTHPSAGLWSYYHVIDSAAATREQAWAMGGAMLRQLPQLPVLGPGVPADDRYAVLSTTDWMPYAWSVNNVTMNENAHAGLALWQAGRPAAAYRLTKSALLASMYMGISPGNVGTMNYLDVYRRESQRDFADGAGTLSRAIVEGLFGLRPDALQARLLVAPGLPDAWTHASIRHPDVGLAWRRSGAVERWTLTQPGTRFDTVSWRLPARQARLVSAKVDGKPVKWRVDPDAIGRPFVLIDTPAGRSLTLALTWAGEAITADEGDGELQPRRQGAFAWRAASGTPPKAAEPGFIAEAPPAGEQQAVDLGAAFNDRVVDLIKKDKYRAPRTSVSLGLPSQGVGAWAGHVQELPQLDDSGLRTAGTLTLPDGGRFMLPDAADGVRAVVVSNWSNHPPATTVPLAGQARYLRLLMVGTTNPMQSRLDNGEVVVTYADGGQARLALHNPTSWWPVEKDYLIDDYQFRSPGARPLRVDLKTAQVRVPDGRERRIPGGSATVLGLALDPTRTLQSVTVRALAQDVVIGVIAATLTR